MPPPSQGAEELQEAGKDAKDPQERRSGIASSVLRRRPRPRLDLLELCRESVLRDLGVVGCLGSQPVAVRQAEEAAQTEVGVRRDGAASGDDLADALGGYADLLGEPVLRDPRGTQEFLQQELSGSHRWKLGLGH